MYDSKHIRQDKHHIILHDHPKCSMFCLLIGDFEIVEQATWTNRAEVPSPPKQILGMSKIRQIMHKIFEQLLLASELLSLQELDLIILAFLKKTAETPSPNHTSIASSTTDLLRHGQEKQREDQLDEGHCLNEEPNSFTRSKPVRSCDTLGQPGYNFWALPMR